MSFFIAGTGSALPALSVDNYRFESIVETSDEWISVRTGIKSRKFLDGGQTLSDLAVEASKKALKSARILPHGLDLIICATLQGDYIMPSLACVVQKNLGADCPAMDINAACTGFIYALDVADGYFGAGKINTALVVCAEGMSKFLDFTDRSTCVLFGDGAGAVVLKRGQGLRYISIKATGEIQPLNIAGLKAKNPFGGTQDCGQNFGLRMDGQEVFKFAVSTVTNDIKDALKHSGISSNEISYYFLHQANKRILDMARMFLKEPEEKFPQNLERLGNTSAASIPILLDELNNKEILKEGQLLLLSAFGGGYTSGTAILEWKKVY